MPNSGGFLHLIGLNYVTGLILAVWEAGKVSIWLLGLYKSRRQARGKGWKGFGLRNK